VEAERYRREVRHRDIGSSQNMQVRNTRSYIFLGGIMRDPGKLAEEHWEWINKLLEVDRLMTERLFKDGFIHGWKHAEDEINEKINESLRERE